LPAEPTDQQIRDGVRRWLELLATGDYRAAIDTVYFRWAQTAEALCEQIEGFFGQQHRSPPARPSDEVMRRSEVYRESIPDDCEAVVGFFVPLVNGLGIWTTFLVRKQEDSTFFEFEIFHL
jgi:hypothetical protein